MFFKKKLSEKIINSRSKVNISIRSITPEDGVSAVASAASFGNSTQASNLTAGAPAATKKYGEQNPNTMVGMIEKIANPVIQGVAFFFYALFNVVFVLLPFLFDYIINHTKSTATSVTTDSAALDTSAAYQAASAVLDTRADYVRTRAAYNAACDTADGADSDVEAAYDAACDAFLPLYEAAIDAYNVARAAYDAACDAADDPDGDAIAAYDAACVAYAPLFVAYTPDACTDLVSFASQNPEKLTPSQAALARALAVALEDAAVEDAYHAYKSACDAYDAACDRLANARDDYDAALRSGVRPDTDAYTAAIAACATTQNAKIVAAETYRTLEPDLFALMRR